MQVSTHPQSSTVHPQSSTVSTGLQHPQSKVSSIFVFPLVADFFPVPLFTLSFLILSIFQPSFPRFLQLTTPSPPFKMWFFRIWFGYPGEREQASCWQTPFFEEYETKALSDSFSNFGLRNQGKSGILPVYQLILFFHPGRKGADGKFFLTPGRAWGEKDVGVKDFSRGFAVLGVDV